MYFACSNIGLETVLIRFVEHGVLVAISRDETVTTTIFHRFHGRSSFIARFLAIITYHILGVIVFNVFAPRLAILCLEAINQIGERESDKSWKSLVFSAYKLILQTKYFRWIFEIKFRNAFICCHRYLTKWYHNPNINKYFI